MSDAPKVSSVVIAFNNEETVAECVESVMTQEYPNKETLVVFDEGSTDGTQEKLEMLVAENKGNMRLVTIRHSGRSAARNVGWKATSGELVFFADADDLYNNDYLAKAVAAFGRADVGCVCVTGASLAKGDHFAPRMLRIYSALRQASRDDDYIPTWAWVYRRRALEDVGGFDEKLSQAEDKDLFRRVRSLGYSAAVVSGVNWHHRRPTTNSAYFTKTFMGGVRRVPFLAKSKDYAGFMRSTAIVWLAFGSLVAGVILPPTLLLALSALVVFIGYRILVVARVLWRTTSDRIGLLLYPVFSILSHTVSAAGTLFGIVEFYVARIAKRLGSRSVEQA